MLANCSDLTNMAPKKAKEKKPEAQWNEHEKEMTANITKLIKDHLRTAV